MCVFFSSCKEVSILLHMVCFQASSFLFWLYVVGCFLWLRISVFIPWPLLTSLIPFCFMSVRTLIPLFLVWSRPFVRPSLVEANVLFALETATQTQLLYFDIRAGFSFVSHTRILLRLMLVLMAALEIERCGLVFALVAFSHLQNIVWGVSGYFISSRVRRRNTVRVFSAFILLGIFFNVSIYQYLTNKKGMLLKHARFSLTGLVICVELFFLH